MQNQLASLQVNGIAVPVELRNTRNGLRFKKFGFWYVTTRGGTVLGKFLSEVDADSWWKRFQQAEFVPFARPLVRGEPNKLQRHGLTICRKNVADMPDAELERLGERFVDLMLEEFVERYPEFKKQTFYRDEFLAAIEKSFPQDFVRTIVVAMQQNEPGEDDGILTWMLANRLKYRDKFRLGRVAETIRKAIRLRKLDSGRVEHRPVGRGKPGGRWGA